MEASTQRHFRIHHGLGRGGFGEVYRATMTSHGGLRAEVAVKLLRVDINVGGEAVRRLRDEGRMLAALRHPTILRVYDLAKLDGRVGLVTEFVDGEDLTGCIAPGLDKPMPRSVLLEVMGLIAEGLHAAHTATSPETGEPMHLVHRDIKPSNLRLSRHGEVKILDFGIARSESVDREARTGSHATLGSLAYMSPERFDRHAPGPPADVFALGCVLYEALAGVRYHEDAVPIQMVRLAASEDTYTKHLIAAFEHIPDDTPEGIVELCRTMLAYSADARPTATFVAARCEDLAHETPGPTLKRWARGRTWPTPELVPSPFDGRNLTDGTLTTNTQSDSAELPRQTTDDTFHFDGSFPTKVQATVMPPAEADDEPRRRLLPILGLLALIALLMGLGAAFVLQPEVKLPKKPVPTEVPDRIPEVDELAPRPAPVPALEPLRAEPKPEPAPVSPPPIPQPAPTAPAPVPAPAPQPAPAPEPEPEPEPEPVPANGTVKVTGAELAKLVGPLGVFRTSEVPGGTYEVFVTMRGQEHSLGQYTVPAKGMVSFECNTMTMDCKEER